MDVEFPAYDRLMRTMIYNRGILIVTLILSLVCAVLFIGDGLLWASHFQTETAYRPHPHDGANDMPKVDDETLRQRYEKAKTDWEGRQKENRAQKRREKTQADARRKTLIGEMVLHHVQANPHEHDRLMTRLDSYLEAPRDRALFDLSPRPNAPASTPQTDPPSPTDSSRP